MKKQKTGRGYAEGARYRADYFKAVIKSYE